MGVLSQCNTRLRLLHLLYDKEVIWRKTITHAFSMFYTVIKDGFLTNDSARRVLSILEIGFFRGLKISGIIFSRRYELSRDSRESILGVVVCKFILLVFSGGDSLLFFMSSEQEAGGSLSPDLAVVLDAQKNAILAAVNSQIQGLQTTLLQAQSDLAVQIVSDLQPDTYVFKKKGNEQQFSFNRKVARTSGAALEALESGDIPKAKEELNKGISLVNTRQKIIKLADKSEFGWATLQEHVSDELADDKADASKIEKAEKRAAVKIKTLQEKKKTTSSKVSSASAPPSFSASRPGGSFGSFPSASSYFRPQSRYSYNSFRASDMCFRCGKRDHWANFCNSRDKPLSSGSKP